MSSRNPWEDRFSGIVTFIAVVNAGSFSGAAFHMNLTRSAIAKSIAKLEQRLGLKLFHRTTRQQTLTHEGGMYFEHCLAMLDDLDSLESELRDGQVGPEGRLRISCPTLFGRHCIAPAIRKLTRQYPSIQIETEFSDHVVDILSAGFDLTIRLGKPTDSTAIIAKKIAVQRMAVFASPSYLNKFGTPVALNDFQQHRGILYGRAAHTYSWPIQSDDGKTVSITPPGTEIYDDLQVIADSAVEGGGLAWLPSWLGAPYVESGQLKQVTASQRAKPIDIYIVWPKTKYLPRRTRLLIDYLAEHVPLLMAH
ncbi:LysR family transcriptional regulator [Gallaecimonas mangrovi]|uniref:LysR family transcriptional regulator n=1 Tax=Gallaecimonas mangrovi TaxID=2291597 RepID=UPI000E202742|nr:LysR family transcriptional regulator [Gallaecimonas mangrovi]